MPDLPSIGDIPFVPPAPPELPIWEPEPTPEPPEAATPPASDPFTPDGSGTVMDNSVEPNNREFFTIRTEDGHVFYLIIDRLRGSENVYFLSAVTVEDLMSLAQGERPQGAFPMPEPTPPPVDPFPPPESEPEPEPDPEPPERPASNRGQILIVLLAVLGIGGAGYYLKIVKPKRQAAEMDEDYDEEGEAETPVDEYGESDRVYDDYMDYEYDDGEVEDKE